METLAGGAFAPGPALPLAGVVGLDLLAVAVAFAGWVWASGWVIDVDVAPPLGETGAVCAPGFVLAGCYNVAGYPVVAAGACAFVPVVGFAADWGAAAGFLFIAVIIISWPNYLI